MKKFVFPILVFMAFMSCNIETPTNAEAIINKTIEVAGGNFIAKATIDFDFRDKHYKAIRNNGLFQLEREFKDSTNVIRDVYSNTNFKRFVNNEAIAVHDSMAAKYTSSVNSVHYFAVLPYSLDGAAVNKKFQKEEMIKGQNYYKIEVTFNQEGGGEDYEDVFVYWINTETFKIDYLAYSYIEDNDVGLRFREAYNERYIKDIRFVDYNNYKPKTQTADLFDLGQLFENDQLKLLSKIETGNVVVNRN